MFVFAQSKVRPLTKSETELIARIDKRERLRAVQNVLDTEARRTAYQFMRRTARSNTLQPFFKKNASLQVFISKDGAGTMKISSHCYVGGTLYIHRDGSLSSDHGIVNCEDDGSHNKPNPIKNAEEFSSATRGMSLEELTKRIIVALKRVQ